MNKEALIFMLVAQIVVQTGIWLSIKDMVFSVIKLTHKYSHTDMDTLFDYTKVGLFAINLGISFMIIKFTKGGAIAGASNFLASGFLYFVMMYNYWKFKRSMLKHSRHN